MGFRDMNSSTKHLLKHYWRRLPESLRYRIVKWRIKIWLSINSVLCKLQGGRLMNGR